MTTSTLSNFSLKTQKASETWCISGRGYQVRQSLKLDRTHVMASVFANTLNPEAPQ